MEIKEISNIYSALPQCGAFLKALSDKSMRHIFLKGMYASSASVFFAAVCGSEKVKGKSEKLKEKREKGKVKNPYPLQLFLYYKITMRLAISIMTLRRYWAPITCCFILPRIAEQ